MRRNVLDSMLIAAGRELMDAAEERKLLERIDMMTNTSPRLLGPGSDLDELTVERDRVRGILADVEGQLLRLNSGSMGDAEREAGSALQRVRPRLAPALPYLPGAGSQGARRPARRLDLRTGARGAAGRLPRASTPQSGPHGTA